MYIDKFILQLIFTGLALVLVIVLCYGVSQISYKIHLINPLKWSNKLRKRMIKWYNNPRKLRKKKKQQSRRSRFISSAVKQKVWERDKGKCVLCGSTIDLEYDHDIPFSKGGSNSEENIRLLCRRCNRSKSAKIQ